MLEIEPIHSDRTTDADLAGGVNPMRLTRMSTGDPARAAVPAIRPLTWFVGRAAPSVASPAASAALPTRPVLLVHGLGGTEPGWYAVAGALHAHGETVAVLSYRPFARSVGEVAERLAETAATMVEETSADKVHLVGHSLGGVVIAQAFADGLLTGQVVTIASPLGGSPWASLLPVGSTARALRDGTPVLRRLAPAPTPEGVSWLAISATSDLVVPARRPLPAPAVTSPVEALPTYGRAAA
jgi:pimeloyl-ACP methyl ester carboxylesterase